MTLHLVEIDPAPIMMDPRPCGLCGLTIDKHDRDDTPQGPLFFCADLSPDEMTLLELERRAELRRQEEVAAMVERMESADPRDRWKRTGEPPPDSVRNGPQATVEPAFYRTAQSVIDTFWYVVALKDTDRLSAWLRDHPRDTSFLLKLLEAK